jgi:hypothetical protein
MTKLTNEEIERLIDFSQWLFDDGFVNFTYKDYQEFKNIKKKFKGGKN